jgi:hypothetical protein
VDEFALLGTDLFGNPISRDTDSKVCQAFIFPPFSVLNARDGAWQERKRAWLDMGIVGELGRDSDLLYGDKVDSIDFYRHKEGERKSTEQSNTSAFDPTLCELVYSWFSRVGDQVVDPFAGGCVRGVVASCLGRRYWGCDLSSKQIDANRTQASSISSASTPIHWVGGDSLHEVAHSPEADFVFSCPPYGDLEQYSDDPADLSAMDHDLFFATYREIIALSCARLKQDRFACFVVGDYRCSKGYFRNFVGHTVSCFDEAGVRLYNDAVLVTPVASAAMRVTQQFEASRKFAKTHQNVLVFCKGDPKKATLRLK